MLFWRCVAIAAPARASTNLPCDMITIPLTASVDDNEHDDDGNDVTPYIEDGFGSAHVVFAHAQHGRMRLSFDQIAQTVR